MATSKLDLKKVAVIAGCVSAVFSLAAFCAALFFKGKSCETLWFLSTLCIGLYFCVARPYFATGTYKLEKADNLLYWVFGAALVALLFSKSPWLSIILMALSAIACYIIVFADKKLEPKEYTLALVGLAACIYALFGILQAVGAGVFGFFANVLVSAALVLAAIFLVNDHLSEKDKEFIKEKTQDVTEKAKEVANEVAENAKGIVKDVKDAVRKDDAPKNEAPKPEEPAPEAPKE